MFIFKIKKSKYINSSLHCKKMRQHYLIGLKGFSLKHGKYSQLIVKAYLTLVEQAQHRVCVCVCVVLISLRGYIGRFPSRLYCIPPQKYTCHTGFCTRILHVRWDDLYVYYCFDFFMSAIKEGYSNLVTNGDMNPLLWHLYRSPTFLDLLNPEE